MYDWLEGYEKIAAIIFIAFINAEMLIVWYLDEIKKFFTKLFDKVFFFLKAGNKNKS